MLVVLRVWLPDRPGALGQVASRIGAVRGDLLAIDILEAGAGRAIDEFVVAIDEPRLVDLMVSEVTAVDGVTVEDVRIIDGDRRSPEFDILEAAIELAETVATRGVICRAVESVLDADWCAVTRDGIVVEATGPVPESVPVAIGRTTVAGGESDEVIAVDMNRSGLRIVAGRRGRPIHERERTRITMLARLADAVIAERST